MDFDFSGIIPAIPGLWNGMVMTLQLMVMGVVGGIVLGTILALMRLSSSKLLSRVAGAYVNYFRSIPLLLVITWFYLAVPFVLRWITGEDTPIGAFTSCVVAFMMFEPRTSVKSSGPACSRSPRARWPPHRRWA
jgi:glutamate/aspartate transport system permease protein